MRSIQHTWAVSLLASGSAMIMRCKAWNCTLMWGPPNKKTEITTHFEQRSCILTAFLGNIWWHTRTLTAFSGKDSGFVTDNVSLFTWTGASVYQLLFSILGCHCRGRWPTRSSELFWICITFLFSKYFHRSCFTFMLETVGLKFNSRENKFYFRTMRQPSIIIRSRDSRTRFKFCMYYLVTEWPWAGYLTPVASILSSIKWESSSYLPHWAIMKVKWANVQSVYTSTCT